MAVDLNDVRVFIPRIRRELDPGAQSITSSAASGYSDEQLKNVAADSIGMLIAIAGPTLFPYVLSITNADTASAAWDWEYRTDPEIPLHLHGLVALQAAIDQIYQDFLNFKTKEKISDEGSSWEIDRSATVFKDRLNGKVSQRNAILERLKIDNPELVLDAFINTLYERDATIAAEVEAFYDVNQSGAGAA